MIPVLADMGTEIGILRTSKNKFRCSGAFSNKNKKNENKMNRSPRGLVNKEDWVPKLEPVGVFIVNNEEFIVGIRNEGEDGFRYICFGPKTTLEWPVVCKIQLTEIQEYIKVHLPKKGK